MVVRSVKSAIEVVRVPQLDLKYEHDLALLEGRYESLEDLHKKVMELDVLHGHGDVAKRAYELVKQKFHTELSVPDENGRITKFKAAAFNGKILAYPLGHNLNIVPKIEGFEETLLEILEKNNITYLKNRLAIWGGGLYEDRSCYGRIPLIEGIKIADIKTAA